MSCFSAPLTQSAHGSGSPLCPGTRKLLKGREGHLGYPVRSRKPWLACTMGQSGWLGSDSTKDCCSFSRGARRETGRAGLDRPPLLRPEMPEEDLNSSALERPAEAKEACHSEKACMRDKDLGTVWGGQAWDWTDRATTC